MFSVERLITNKTESHRPPNSDLLWNGLFLLVILSAGVIRFYHLAFESLWMDELNQVASYSLSLKGVVLRAAAEQQPPLDYLIGYCLAHLGLSQSDWWVRFPAACFGIATLLLLLWWGRRMLGNYAALAAVVVLAVSPLHVSMSQEARPYTIFVFFALLCMVLFANAHAKPNRFNWALFATSLFLLLLTRWVGPIVLTMQFVLFTIAYAGYCKFHEKSAKEYRYRPIYSILAFSVPILCYLPFFYNVYENSQKYITTGHRKSIDKMLTRGVAMLKHSSLSCFSNMWAISIVMLGILILVLYFFLHAKGWLKLYNEEKSKSKYIDLSLFLVVSLGFITTYIAIYVYNTFASPKPQYLLLLAPFGAIYIGLAINSIRELIGRFSKSLSIVAYSLLIIAVCLPMYRQAVNHLTSHHKRDWRGVGNIVSQFQEIQPVFFLSVTSALTAWSPPVCGLARYVKGKKYLQTTIRKLASGDYDKDTKFGTIYAVVYKDFHGSFPIPKRKPFEGLTAYDLNGLLLYRFPGSPETSSQRLILLLSYLAAGAKNGSGLSEVDLAMSHVLLSLGDIKHAKGIFFAAFDQCRNQNERNYFQIVYGNRQKYGPMLKLFGL